MNIKSLMAACCATIFMAACSGDSAESLTQKGNEALASGDVSAAVEMFSKAADKGSASAARQLGMLYAEGKGTDKSLEKSAELYALADQLGDSVAPFLLGNMYETGSGVTSDGKKALELYEKSAAAGHAPAQAQLTDIDFRGRDNIEVDWGKAYTMSQKASAGGNADAMAIEGFFLGTGNYGAEKDVKKAIELLRKSVDNGSNLGKALYGYILFWTNSGTKAEAIKMIQESAQAGEPFGIAFTGYCHECGYLSASFSKANKYYEEAADKGCVWAMARHGMVSTDLQYKKQEGHQWWARAAERGDGEALSQMGYKYLNGYSVEKSPEKAIECFNKGAQKGNPTAMSNLGYCYEEGEGVPADKEKAIMWYQKAVKYGDPYYSQERLKRLGK